MKVTETLADYAASQIAIMVDNGWPYFEAVVTTTDHLHDLVYDAMDEAQAKEWRRSGRG